MARFEIGDKVTVKQSALEYGFLQKRGFDADKVYTVSGLYSERDYLWFEEIKQAAHYSYFELYKEPEEQTMKQPKTKRIPFTHEMWEKYKDVAKIIYIPSDGEVLGFAYFHEADSRFRYAYLTRSGTAPTFGSGECFWLEIPVTTKRIPFNPELKDAKVFYGDTELIEWVYMSSNFVCGVHEQVSPFKSLETALYHPNHLEMEIEDV